MEDEKAAQATNNGNQEQTPVVAQAIFGETVSGSLVDLPDQPSDTEIYHEIRSAPARQPAAE